MKYELEANQYVLRIYEDDAEETYVAVAQVRVYGDRAWVSSISSPLFYKAMGQYFNEWLDKLGVVCFEGYMSKAHARAVRMACRTWGKFEITHYGGCAGRQMPWVVVSRLDMIGI